MLLRAVLFFLIVCTGCRSGIIPCPEVKGLKLKKSAVNKRFRPHEPEPVVTVSSDAKTPQQTARNKYKYVKYTIEHVDVEELDCPRPGDKKMPKAIKNNIRKNRKKVRYYQEMASSDSLRLMPFSQPRH